MTQAVPARALVLALAAVAAEARAGDGSQSPDHQLWLEASLGKTSGERTYLELDLEPRWQLTQGDEWRSFRVVPQAVHYPTSWLDLIGDLKLVSTRQSDGPDSFELTPRAGARIHLFAKLAPHRPGLPGLESERLPLTRVGFSTLVRVEWRNLFYTDDTPDSHQWRARVRFEARLALNHAKLSQERTLYAMADVEYFAPLGDDVEETYVNKLRGRLGAGFRFSRATRLECLYVRDWNKSAPDADAAEDVQALDVHLKLLF